MKPKAVAKFKDPEAEFAFGKAAYRPHPKDARHALYCNEPMGRGHSCNCSQAWKDAMGRGQDG